MKIGMITDSLGGLSFDAMLEASAELGLETLEFACGNWSQAPHINLSAMLESEGPRREFMAKVRDHGMEIAALNCSGNPLHPGKQGAPPQGHPGDNQTREPYGHRTGGDDVKACPVGQATLIQIGSLRIGRPNVLKSSAGSGIRKSFLTGATLSHMPTT